MQAYVLRRLMIMVPTFFGIALVIFVVLNLAPGRPGMPPSSDFAQNVRSERSQETFRIFREQFNLDKPIVFNTRFLLQQEEILQKLRVIVGKTPGAAAKEKIAAQDAMEDYGGFAVPHLVALLRLRDTEPEVRDAA